MFFFSVCVHLRVSLYVHFPSVRVTVLVFCVSSFVSLVCFISVSFSIPSCNLCLFTFPCLCLFSVFSGALFLSFCQSILLFCFCSSALVPFLCSFSLVIGQSAFFFRFYFHSCCFLSVCQSFICLLPFSFCSCFLSVFLNLLFYLFPLFCVSLSTSVPLYPSVHLSNFFCNALSFFITCCVPVLLPVCFLLFSLSFAFFCVRHLAGYLFASTFLLFTFAYLLIYTLSFQYCTTSYRSS